MTEQPTVTPAFVEGEKRDFTFTAAGGESVTITATYDTTWRDELQPCVGVDEVFGILYASQEVDAAHRHFLWPSTDHSDDDTIIAYLWEDGIVMDTWKTATPQDRYSLDDLLSLLPDSHYTLTVASAPEEAEWRGATRPGRFGPSRSAAWSATTAATPGSSPPAG